MAEWQPEQYLLFEAERTRPCRDLAAAVPVDDPGTIVDLGCGPCNSTAVLGARWPKARIAGVDSSAKMLERARADYPDCEWIEMDIASWAAQRGDQYDIVFSNAALHWLDDHRTLYPLLLRRVAAGGALAIQMPANLDSPAQRMMRTLASSARWASRFPRIGVKDWFAHDSAFYYDLVAPLVRRIILWETTYVHVLPDVRAISEWYKSTGLRPFLEALASDKDRAEYLNDYTEELAGTYPKQADGRVLFPFRRSFLVALP